MILYFAEVAGSMTLGMSVLSVMMLATTVFELPSGLMSDAMGRKRVLVFGALASLVSALAYALSQGVWLLYVGAVFDGLSVALFSGNNDALLYDLLKSEQAEETYKGHLGRISSMAHGALTVAAVAGTLVLNWSSYSMVMWLSVVPRVICLLLTLWVDEPRTATIREGVVPWRDLVEVLREVRENPRLVKLIVADSLSGGVGEASYQFRAAFLRMVWPLWAIGLTGALGDFGAAVSYWFSGKVIDKIGAKKSILLEKLYSLCCNVISYAMQNSLSPILLTSTSMFYGLVNVAKNDLSQRLYSDRHRASMASVKSLATTLVGALAAVVMGIVADHLGAVTALLAFQTVSVVVILLYWDILREPEGSVRTPSRSC